MAIFCLGANEPDKDIKTQIKNYLNNCIIKRRTLMKSKTTGSQAIVFQLLPDYVLPYVIHLLAHDGDLIDNEDVESLKNTKEFVLNFVQKTRIVNFFISQMFMVHNGTFNHEK